MRLHLLGPGDPGRRLRRPLPLLGLTVDGALSIHTDARVYGTLLEADRSLTHDLAPGRHAWVQVARGAVELGGERLDAGDGAAVGDVDRVTMTGLGPDPAEVLLFDLA
ncbi:MAG TPA: hypothetical protein RMF84_13005 [Polyangiaceae bacterium LLY-WYZ-14_1]|nr:hypothetical protein [Polyangiaceae bacterium LLY-WYZ-14_1]